MAGEVIRENCCSACVFWKALDKDDPDETSGRCMRYAPKPKMTKPEVRSYDLIDWAVWPLTSDDDWCGEHKPLKETNRENVDLAGKTTFPWHDAPMRLWHWRSEDKSERPMYCEQLITIGRKRLSKRFLRMVGPAVVAKVDAIMDRLGLGERWMIS